ncbi:MAG: protein kinase [Deltaproteobacteria bacterium]|jgi:serine/threonine-protein kinase|nr:protein kinase [Deltaproteobacteria bacterium]
MTLADLAKLVPADLGSDLDEHYAQFKRRHGARDLGAFLQYLLDAQIIDGMLYAKLCSSMPLEVTVRSEADARRLSLTMGERGTAVMADKPEARLLEAPSAPALDTGARPGEEASPAQQPPRYVLLGLLGKGAMGEVHLARDVYLRRQVAFKHLASDGAGDSSSFARFLAEMQITSQLDHPNVVPVYGLEVAPDGAVAYAMKLVQGREYADLLEQTRLQLAEQQPLDEEHGLEHRLECFLKVCDAVDFAHDRGIVHRDLKPTNIMLGAHNEVYLMDWGIARPIGGGEIAAEAGLEVYDPAADGGDVTRTRVGTALGTVCYMSPEQAAGRNDELDGRSDQYTLGLILQEVITLERAVPGSTLREVYDNARRAVRSPAEPNAASIRVPRELTAIIDRATQERPVRRYETVAAMAADIRRYLRGDAVLAQPDSALQHAARWLSKHRTASLAIVAVAVALAVASAIVAMTISHEQAVVREAERMESTLRTERDALALVVSHTSVGAHRLDRLFASLESELEQVAGAAAEALSSAAGPPDGPLYFVESFGSEGAGPDDLAPSAVYQRRISLKAPALWVAAGVEREHTLAELQQLRRLHPVYGRAMIDSRYDDGYQASAARARRIIADEGTPIRRVTITLASGAGLIYPGMEGLPAADLRQRPSYRIARDAPGLHWGEPRRAGSAETLRLPCSTALRDRAGLFRGVATIEVVLARDGIGLLPPTAAPRIGAALLVRPDGAVVLVERAAGSELAEVDALASGKTPILPWPQVRAAIAESTAGHRVIPGEPARVIAYQRLDEANFAYVTVSSHAALLGSEPRPGPSSRASAPRLTAAPATTSSASAGAVPSVALEVVPPFAAVTVDGEPRQVLDGRLVLRGPVGSKHRVVVTVAGEESSYEVVITERGPRPWQVRAVQLVPGSSAAPGQEQTPPPYEPTIDPYD